METMVDEIPPTIDTAAPASSVAEARAGSDGDGPAWRELFASIARGEAQGLHRLYDRAAHQLYGLALWRTGSKEDASDVVQEVFVRVAEQGPRLEEVKNPKAWLLTVVHRLAVDLTRRRKVRDADSLDAHPYLQAAADDPERVVDAERASTLLAMLPGKQREVVYLRHFAECTFAEIGHIVGVPTFTASSRYRLGVQRLRRLMETDR
jgi:RNA polymerase sigma-70 factor (ECF subfamily)